MLLKQIIESAKLNPKSLLLIDGLGAILSAFLLGIVLVRFESVFGIPSSTLYILATFPIFFAIYDFYFYRKWNDKSGPFLKGISILNLLYCCLSFGCAIYHFRTITNWGWTYILIEILIVSALAIVELIIANKIIRNFT